MDAGSKPLPIVGLAGVALALLVALLVRGIGVAVLAVLAAVVAGVLAILQKDRQGVVTGVLLLVVALAGAFVAIGNVSFEGGTSVGDGDDADADAMAVALGLLTAAAVVPARWDTVHPRWVGLAGIAAALVGVLVAFSGKATLGEYQEATNYGVAVLALAAGVPAALGLVGRKT